MRAARVLEHVEGHKVKLCVELCETFYNCTRIFKILKGLVKPQNEDGTFRLDLFSDNT